MAEQKNNVGKIVLAFDKRTLTREHREFIHFEIPTTEPLREIPETVKTLYFDEKSLEGITRECGYKQVYFGEIMRADCQERYPATYFNYPLKNAEEDGLPVLTSLLMMWIGERQEWVAIIDERKLGKEVKHSYQGPYSLDDYCAEGIRVSYKIMPNIFSSAELTKTSPGELEKIRGDCKNEHI